MPTGWSTQIMGSSFRRGLNSEMVAFSTTLAVQPSPLYKSNWEKSKMAVSYFVYPAIWLAQMFYYSFQVKPNQKTDWPLFFGKDFTFWQSDKEIYWHNHVIQKYKNSKIFFCFSLWYFYDMSIYIHSFFKCKYWTPPDLVLLLCLSFIYCAVGHCMT